MVSIAAAVQVGPPSDVWAAGVMAYQLLSGYLPFDDHKHRDAPSLSKVWKAILTEDVAFKGKAWEQVSPEAKDFVTSLLNKCDLRPLLNTWKATILLACHQFD